MLSFLLSYLLMFILSIVPFAAFGEGMISILLFLMMNAGYSVSVGLISLGWSAPLLFLAVSYITHEPLLGLLFALAATLPVLVGNLLYKKKMAFGEMMAGTGAALFIPYALWEMFSLRKAGYSAAQLFEESAKSVVETVRSMEMLEEADLLGMEAMLRAMVPYLVGILPVLYLILALIGAFAVLKNIDRMMMHLAPTARKRVPSFDELKLPAPLAVLFLPLMFAALLVPYETGRIMALCGAIFIGFLSVTCGFSLIDRIFSRYVRSGFFRIIIYILLVNMTSILILFPIGILGGVDGIFDFRKGKRK